MSDASPRIDWRAPAALVLLSLVPSVSGVFRVLELARGAPVTAMNARFVTMPWPVLIHIIGAVPFGLIGAFQFSAALRRRAPRWHLVAGRGLFVFGVLVAVSGLWMTMHYPWPDGDGLALYGMRLVAGGAMLMSLLLGLDAIRLRAFTAHGAWMMRAYAIGMGAGTQVFTHLPWLFVGSRPGESGRAVAMALGWLINIAVAEWVIAREGGAARQFGGAVAPSLASRGQ